MFGHAEVERVILEDTRAGDEKQRVAPKERSHVQSAASTSDEPRDADARRLAPAAAAMKPAKSGCGRVGRDWSSGWNWQPMNHGWFVSSTISTSCPSGDRPLSLM